MNFTLINKVGLQTAAMVTVVTMVLGLAPLPSHTVAAQAAPSCTVVSDASTKEDGSNSFESDTATLPGAWATISGAKWIWGDADFLNAPAGSQTFVKKFIVNGSSTAAELKILSDNNYDVRLNGSIVYIDNSENNFGLVATHDVLSKLIMNAENTIEIKVTNLEGNGPNPAGLAFKIAMEGSTCDRLPLPDLCSNIDGRQEAVPSGYEANGGVCSPVAITTGTDPIKRCIGSENLILNGSFEDPVIGASYSVVGAVSNWLSSTLDGFEIWRNLDGGAAAGQQNLELDVNAPSTVSQTVGTVAGNEYQVSFAFAPRVGTNAADNKVEVAFGGNVLGTVSADGGDYPVNTWTYHNFVTTVTGTSSLVELRDLGTSRAGYGSLVDDVSVCLVEDNTPVEEPKYTISGFKFNDANADGIFTNDEEKLPNWEIVLTDEDDVVTYATTNSDGNYSFTVAPGFYKVSETGQKGWEQTATIGDGADGNICYITVTDRNVAAEAAQYTCDFGNHEITERRSGGSNSGTRVKRTSSTQTGEVLGASTSTPTGVVLGDATTTMPVGAPNTGAGGTSPISVSLPSMVAILSTSTRKSK